MYRPPENLYPFESQWLKIAGNRMHFLDEGPRDAPIVLMVHGNPTWSFYYRNLVIALRDRYRCIVPDHIGCGLSDKPAAHEYPYTLERRISDLDALMSHIQPQTTVHLVVHDWGGMIGFGWAVDRPEEIGNMVIGNTAAFPLPAEKKLPAALWLVRNTKLGALLVQGLNAFSGIAARVAFKKPVSKEVRNAYTGPYDSWDNRIATLRFVQDIPLKPSDPGYSIIQVTESRLSEFADKPCLLAWGEKDFVFDRHFLKQWKRLFPQAKVLEYPDCGHYIFEDGGQALTQAISDFMDQNEHGTERN
ncbi:MAG: alpha/beta fold hydrolase [Xanthomonadales bacterium]|nr:alpha/beta fold hydrolase [Xanthomonadales bacterium]